MHFFLAHDLYESPMDGDEDEFIERVRMPLDEALAAIQDGRIVDGKSVAGLLRAAHRPDV